MTHDHRTTTIHQAELDHEIDTIRNERLIAASAGGSGLFARVRRTTGRVLVAAGTALIGSDQRLRAHRA